MSAHSIKPVAVSNSAIGDHVNDPHAHSSTLDSTAHMGLAHADPQRAQFDDGVDDTGADTDPNMSGNTPTEQTYTWLAGPLTHWSENDDYRTFFEQTETPDSRLYDGFHQRDNDYDDNGGVPTGIGQPRGIASALQRPPAANDTEQGEYEGTFPLPRLLKRDL